MNNSLSQCFLTIFHQFFSQPNLMSHSFSVLSQLDRQWALSNILWTEKLADFLFLVKKHPHFLSLNQYNINKQNIVTVTLDPFPPTPDRWRLILSNRQQLKKYKKRRSKYTLVEHYIINLPMQCCAGCVGVSCSGSHSDQWETGDD